MKKSKHDVHQRVEKLHLNLFIDGFGHHVASWRHPDSQLQLSAFQRYVRAAQQAEQGKFDAIFFADSLAVDPNVAKSGKTRGHEVEPLTVLSAIAACTTYIGLIGTATTTYNEPYHIARKFASLDLISQGRAGWNLVTTDLATEASNFHLERHVDHAVRYERAEEFFDVVSQLWRSWDEDALIKDQQSGQFFDPDKLHQIDHHGTHFSVAGPLNVAPSPQHHPIVVQAGSSERGKNLAARTADVVFTAQSDLKKAQAFYKDVKERLAQFGRLDHQLKIVPGVYIVVAATQAEAEARQKELNALIDADVGLGLLGRMLGNFDVSQLDVNAPLPDLPQTETGQQSRQQLLTQLSQTEQLTVKQLYERVASGRGHLCLIGTPTYIADQLELWFNEKAADGFNIMPALIETDLTQFVEQVVPILQKRNLLRTEYQTTTLRQHYGLSD